MYLRARYLDPATGRFLSEDPTGLDAGINAYAYVANSPLLLRDPYGLDQEVQGQEEGVQCDPVKDEDDNVLYYECKNDSGDPGVKCDMSTVGACMEYAERTYTLLHNQMRATASFLVLSVTLTVTANGGIYIDIMSMAPFAGEGLGLGAAIGVGKVYGSFQASGTSTAVGGFAGYYYAVQASHTTSGETFVSPVGFGLGISGGVGPQQRFQIREGTFGLPRRSRRSGGGSGW